MAIIMTETVCLPKTHLLIIFLIFIGSASWYIHKDKKKHIDDPQYKYNDMILDSMNKTINDLKNKMNQVENKQETILQKKEEKAPEKIIIKTASPSSDLIVEDVERKLFLNRRDKEMLTHILMLKIKLIFQPEAYQIIII